MRLLNDREHYDVAFNPATRDEWEFVELVWREYGNEYIYKNKATGELVYYYESIGD